METPSSSETGSGSVITVGDRRSENRFGHRIVFPVGERLVLGFSLISCWFSWGFLCFCWDFRRNGRFKREAAAAVVLDGRPRCRCVKTGIRRRHCVKREAAAGAGEGKEKQKKKLLPVTMRPRPSRAVHALGVHPVHSARRFSGEPGSRPDEQCHMYTPKGCTSYIPFI